jgi:hypothetical protein
LWSCTATLRILCSAAPQTNKQNKHKKKMLTWVLHGSGSSCSKLQARSHSKPAPSSKLQARSRSKPAPSSKLAPAQRLWSSGDGVRGEGGGR